MKVYKVWHSGWPDELPEIQCAEAKRTPKSYVLQEARPAWAYAKSVLHSQAWESPQTALKAWLRLQRDKAAELEEKAAELRKLVHRVSQRADELVNHET